MRVALTGAGGFIGSHLADRLVAQGHDVVALVRQEQAASARAGARLLVHCSSSAVYGSRTGNEPVGEDAALRPDSAYARSKARAEAVARSCACEGFTVVVARITAVLGPGCRSWLPLMRSIGRHQLPVIGAGENWHHPADAADIVDGLVLCGSPAPRSAVYNLAGPDPVRLRDLMECIAEELHAEPPGSRPGAPVEWYMRVSRAVERLTGLTLPHAAGARFLTGDRRLDLRRASRELGYQPKIPVRDAVRRTTDWYRSQGLLRRA